VSRLRIVLAEPGSPGPGPTGVHAVARELRDAGVEVIHTGPVADPALVVAAVLQEDADAVAVAERADEVAALLAAADADDIAVVTLDTALSWANAERG